MIIILTFRMEEERKELLKQGKHIEKKIIQFITNSSPPKGCYFSQYAFQSDSNNKQTNKQI